MGQMFETGHSVGTSMAWTIVKNTFFQHLSDSRWCS